MSDVEGQLDPEGRDMVPPLVAQMEGDGAAASSGEAIGRVALDLVIVAFSVAYLFTLRDASSTDLYYPLAVVLPLLAACIVDAILQARAAEWRVLRNIGPSASRSRTPAVVGVIVLSLAYAYALPRLGLMVATWTFTFCLLLLARFRGWLLPVVPLLAAVIFYFLFVRVLLFPIPVWPGG